MVRYAGVVYDNIFSTFVNLLRYHSKIGGDLMRWFERMCITTRAYTILGLGILRLKFFASWKGMNFFQKQIRDFWTSPCSPRKDAPSRRLGCVGWGNDPSWATDILLWMTTNPARTAVTRTNPIVLNTTTVVNSFGCSALTDLSLVLTKEEIEGSDEFLSCCDW